MVLKLVLFALLLVFTAFFVATEFSIIRMRSSRVNQMVAEGMKNARAVEQVTSKLDGYLSACQLGITITALGLGWLGEPTIELILHPIFDRLHIGRRYKHRAVLRHLISHRDVFACRAWRARSKDAGYYQIGGSQSMDSADYHRILQGDVSVHMAA